MEKILVMLSSYNGEQYISKQIETILNQKNVLVDIFIRDDGSSDGTIEILRQYENKYNNIFVEYGKNIGWKKSFLELLYNSKEYCYYAFADQDDIWFDDKLYSAVQYLKNKNENIPLLYYSDFTVSDKNINIISENKCGEPPSDNVSILIHNFLIGCTMVFNKSLRDLFIKHKLNFNFSHDIWIPILANYFGEIVHERNSHIYYVQHENNTFGLEKNIFKQIKNRFNMNKSKDNHFYYALELKNGYYDIMNNNQKRTVDLFINRDLYSRIKLIFDKNFKRFTIKGTIFLKIHSIFFNFDY